MQSRELFPGKSRIGPFACTAHIFLTASRETETIHLPRLRAPAPGTQVRTGAVAGASAVRPDGLDDRERPRNRPHRRACDVAIASERQSEAEPASDPSGDGERIWEMSHHGYPRLRKVCQLWGVESSGSGSFHRGRKPEHQGSVIGCHNPPPESVKNQLERISDVLELEMGIAPGEWEALSCTAWLRPVLLTRESNSGGFRGALSAEPGSAEEFSFKCSFNPGKQGLESTSPWLISHLPTCPSHSGLIPV